MLPRKVLHVLNSSSGGAVLSTLSLMDEFAKRGIESYAVCHSLGYCDEDERLREATGGNVVFTPLYWWNRKLRMPAWRRPLSAVRQIMRTGWARSSTAVVAEFARKHAVDLIHTNTLVTPEGGRAARSLGLPHVWHIRELVGPGNPYRLPYEGAAFGRYMSKHCSRLIANSHICGKQIVGWVPDDMLAIVPNGIQLGRFHPHTAPARPDRLVVAMVGNLTSQTKKHDLFVAAAALVDRELPIEWRFYGHDPSHGGTVTGDLYVDALHAQIRAAGLTDRFTFSGFTKDPAKLMSQVDLLVHPSDTESFGRILVEAMATNLPTIGVRAGGASEIIVDGVTGLLAEKDSPAELARCIERLARDPELRKKLGAAGRQRAIDLYSLEGCANGVLRVYEAAMQHPLGAPAAHALNGNAG